MIRIELLKLLGNIRNVTCYRKSVFLDFIAEVLKALLNIWPSKLLSNFTEIIIARNKKPSSSVSGRVEWKSGSEGACTSWEPSLQSMPSEMEAISWTIWSVRASVTSRATSPDTPIYGQTTRADMEGVGRHLILFFTCMYVLCRQLSARKNLWLKNNSLFRRLLT